MRKPIPPPSAHPSLPPKETDGVIFIFTEKEWPIEIKHVEKGIVVKECNVWTVARGPCLITSP